MGWFEEQIRQRARSDQDVLEDSFYEMAGAVLNKWSAGRAEDERLVAKEALDSILKYYHHKPAEIPESITDLNAQIEYALRPTGLMVREVQLEEGWQRDAYGPMLGCLRDSGRTVALLPGGLWGYYYVDPETGRKLRVTKKTAKLFDSDALCFYRPLPLKKIGIPGLMHYMWQCVTRGDLVLIILATLALTLVGKIEPSVYSMLTGRILKGRQINLLIGAGIFLVASAFAYWLISIVKELLLNRISTKTTMAVQSSVMMRVLSLPVSFFRGYASGDLANRASCVDNLCGMILNMVLSLGLTSLMSLLYLWDIMRFAPALVLPSVAVVLLTMAVSVAASVVQMNIDRRRMKLEAQEQGMSYAMLSGIQKIRLSGSEKRMFARWGRLYAKSAKLVYNPPMFIKLNELITLAITLCLHRRLRPSDRRLRGPRGHRGLRRADPPRPGNGGADPERAAGGHRGKGNRDRGHRRHRGQPRDLPLRPEYPLCPQRPVPENPRRGIRGYRRPHRLRQVDPRAPAPGL